MNNLKDNKYGSLEDGLSIGMLILLLIIFCLKGENFARPEYRLYIIIFIMGLDIIIYTLFDIRKRKVINKYFKNTSIINLRNLINIVIDNDIELKHYNKNDLKEILNLISNELNYRDYSELEIQTILSGFSEDIFVKDISEYIEFVSSNSHINQKKEICNLIKKMKKEIICI